MIGISRRSIIPVIVFARLAIASLNDLIQFASIEPDASTLGTKINLYSLAVNYRQIHIFAYRTVHFNPLVVARVDFPYG